MSHKYKQQDSFKSGRGARLSAFKKLTCLYSIIASRKREIISESLIITCDPNFHKAKYRVIDACVHGEDTLSYEERTAIVNSLSGYNHACKFF